MKICILTHNLDTANGGGRLSFELMQNIRRLNPSIELTLLTTIDTGKNNELPILYPNKFKLLISIFKIRSIIKQCDLVQVFDVAPYATIAWLASIGLKKKIILTTIGSGSIQPLHNPLVGHFFK